MKPYSDRRFAAAKRKAKRLGAEHGRRLGDISGQLAGTTSKLQTDRDFFLARSQAAERPQAFYQRGGTSLRRAMNTVIFGRLYVTDGEITAHELTEVAETLVEADRPGRTYYRRSGGLSGAYGAGDKGSPLPEEGAALDCLTGAGRLAVAFGTNGSSRAALVGLTQHNTNRLVVATGPVVDLRPLRPCVRDSKE